MLHTLLPTGRMNDNGLLLNIEIDTEFLKEFHLYEQ